MATVKQKYLKNKSGNIISPIVSTEACYDWTVCLHNSLEQIEKGAIQACFSNDVPKSYWYANNALVDFKNEIYNNSNGIIVGNSDGSISVHHDGYVKISYAIWFKGSSAGARPWARLIDATQNWSSDYVIESIDNNASGYVTLAASNRIMKCNGTGKYCMYINTSDGQGFSVNQDSSRYPSYITIELV